jgi:8-oxo-dGTP pyrophosphatase MutT (NUDIX family)
LAESPKWTPSPNATHPLHDDLPIGVWGQDCDRSSVRSRKLAAGNRDPTWGIGRRMIRSARWGEAARNRKVRQSVPMEGATKLAEVRKALERPRTRSAGVVGRGRRAAVAAVLRQNGPGLELLFILRAEHPRDPWSGQMAWPGGRVDEGDSDPLATALRETREEIALDLERDAELLGTLSEVRTHLRRGPGPMSVVPFVFGLTGDPHLTPNSEVQETRWVPLPFLLDRRNRGRMVWTRSGVPLVMPCYRFEGRVIWGLTLRMLDELLQLLASTNGVAST